MQHLHSYPKSPFKLNDTLISVRGGTYAIYREICRKSKGMAGIILAIMDNVIGQK